MWLSADPAMGEYIPQAPINDEAKQHNKELPGMGGVYNYVNLHAYHYAGNNPVKYTDPDGREDIVVFIALDVRFKEIDLNAAGYQFYVDASVADIKNAADEMGLTVKVLTGTDATRDNLLAEYANDEMQRVIIVAHGDANGNFFDNERNKVGVKSFEDTTKGVNIAIIDLVICNATNIEEALAMATGLDIRTYNPTDSQGRAKTLRHYHTNTVLQNRIPHSIRRNGIKNPLWQ
jgi:hypothetical protein